MHTYIFILLRIIAIVSFCNSHKQAEENKRMKSCTKMHEAKLRTPLQSTDEREPLAREIMKTLQRRCDLRLAFAG